MLKKYQILMPENQLRHRYRNTGENPGRLSFISSGNGPLLNLCCSQSNLYMFCRLMISLLALHHTSVAFLLSLCPVKLIW